MSEKLNKQIMIASLLSCLTLEALAIEFELCKLLLAMKISPWESLFSSPLDIGSMPSQPLNLGENLMISFPPRDRKLAFDDFLFAEIQ